MQPLTNMQEKTYWMAPHPTTKRYTERDLPEKTGVLVIGSGYTGVVTALMLKRAGVDVTLVEKAASARRPAPRTGEWPSPA